MPQVPPRGFSRQTAARSPYRSSPPVDAAPYASARRQIKGSAPRRAAIRDDAEASQEIADERPAWRFSSPYRAPERQFYIVERPARCR